MGMSVLYFFPLGKTCKTDFVFKAKKDRIKGSIFCQILLTPHSCHSYSRNTLSYERDSDHLTLHSATLCYNNCNDLSVNRTATQDYHVRLPYELTLVSKFGYKNNTNVSPRSGEWRFVAILDSQGTKDGTLLLKNQGQLLMRPCNHCEIMPIVIS